VIRLVVSIILTRASYVYFSNKQGIPVYLDPSDNNPLNGIQRAREAAKTQSKIGKHILDT